jgi:hypothetical protein
VETWEKYCDETIANTTYINTDMGGDSSIAVEAKELGSAMLRSYLQEYGAEEWMDVIAVELPFQVNIKHDEIQADGSIAPGVTPYVGTMDLVYRDTRDGKIYVMDHKTCRALGSANTQYLPLDDQAGAYYAVAIAILRKLGLIGKKEALAGIVYNYLVKSMPDSRPQNADGLYCNKPKREHFVAALEKAGIKTVQVSNATPKKGDYVDALTKAGVDFKKSATTAALEALASEKGVEVLGETKEKALTLSEMEEVAEKEGLEVLGEVSSSQPPKRFERVTVRKTPRQQMSQIKRMGNDLKAMSAVRNGFIEPTKNPNRDCTFCPFQEICEMHEKGMDYSDFAEEIFTTWDPYEAHRKEIEHESEN